LGWYIIIMVLKVSMLQSPGAICIVAYNISSGSMTQLIVGISD
jgi:hypothetical protein